MLDIGMLRKVIDWAENETLKQPYEESEWNQGVWVTNSPTCGTAYCMAGKIVFDHDGLDRLKALHAGDIPGYSYAIGTAERAAEILGVELVDVYNQQRFGSLFSDSTTLEQAREYATELAAKYGEVL